jgi:hypothetical protein
LPVERDAKERIECFCSRRPLLAMTGRDEATGLFFVWIRHSKGGKIVVDVMMTQGSMRITCRECGRVHTISILPDSVKVTKISS